MNNVSGNFFQNQGIFLKFWKRAGETSPPPIVPLVTHLESEVDKSNQYIYSSILPKKKNIHRKTQAFRPIFNNICERLLLYS